MPTFSVSRDGNIATVVLNRPPVNALTKNCYVELASVFGELGDDRRVHCVLLAAGGTSAFCAGLDLKEFMSTTSVEDDLACTRAAHASFLAILNCRLPVVVAVQGPALGAGCVIASMCDLRIAGPRATFGLPEVKVARVGGGIALGRVIADGLMRQMVFSGEPLSAGQALAIGLVQAVVPEDGLRLHATELARKIGQNDRDALVLSKQSLADHASSHLAEAFDKEAEYNTRLFQKLGAFSPAATAPARTSS